MLLYCWCPKAVPNRNDMMRLADYADALVKEICTMAITVETLFN